MTTLPTDNLYKFIALAGIALAISSNIYFNSLVDKTVNAEDEVKLETELAKVEVEHLQILVGDSEFQSLPSLRRWEIIKDKQLVAAKIPQLKTRASRLRDNVNRWEISLCITTSAGTILSISGFLLWYRKVQKLLDKKLLQESTRTNKMRRYDLK